MGAAETGSGKSLAFGLPIIARLHAAMEAGSLGDMTMQSSDGLLRFPRALILTPTRELAIQVQQHLAKAAAHTRVKVGKGG